MTNSISSPAPDVRRFGWAAGALVVALSVLCLVAARPAEADVTAFITNCTTPQLMICSSNGKKVNVNTNKYEWNQTFTLNTDDQGKFSCNGQCAFSIVNCNTGNCSKCENGDWLDHSWGSGDYLLVSLDMNEKSNGYSSSDMKSVPSQTSGCAAGHERRHGAGGR